MANTYLIQGETLTTLADTVREASADKTQMSPGDMPDRITEAYDGYFVYKTSDATAGPNDMLAGATGYVNGQKVVGTIPTTTISTSSFTIPCTVEGGKISGELELAGGKYTNAHTIIPSYDEALQLAWINYCPSISIGVTDTRATKEGIKLSYMYLHSREGVLYCQPFSGFTLFNYTMYNVPYETFVVCEIVGSGKLSRESTSGLTSIYETSTLIVMQPDSSYTGTPGITLYITAA